MGRGRLEHLGCGGVGLVEGEEEIGFEVVVVGDAGGGARWRGAEAGRRGG